MMDNVYTDMIYNALYALVVFLRHPRLTVGNYIAARRFPYSRHDAAAWGLRYACDGADIRAGALSDIRRSDGKGLWGR